jgi:mannose/fructose/N-acetylgalactosamine-specific phosphotransferase system component IIC
MWVDLLVISLWGGLVALDTTAAFQVLISHPLLSCSVVGLLLGNFPIGFTLGIILELVWLAELPVGAAPFSDGNIGATIGAATAIISAELTGRPGISQSLALLLAVFISVFGGRLVILQRNINGKLYQALWENKKLSIKLVEGYHLMAIAFTFLTGALLTALSVWLVGFILMPRLIAFLPASIDEILAPISAAFLGVGCGVLIYLFLNRKNWWLLLISMAGGIALYFG